MGGSLGGVGVVKKGKVIFGCWPLFKKKGKKMEKGGGGGASYKIDNFEANDAFEVL